MRRRGAVIDDGRKILSDLEFVTPDQEKLDLELVSADYVILDLELLSSDYEKLLDLKLVYHPTTQNIGFEACVSADYEKYWI